VVKCQNALRMKEQLVRANANILGVVLNKISKSEYKTTMAAMTITIPKRNTLRSGRS